MREDSKRIARNTMMLYMRMILTMLISLYTSRLFLDVLGVEDFGIYNVVGGVVGMFSLISGSLSSSIGRFLTVEIGRSDFDQLRRVFSTSVNIQIIIAIIIVIGIEVGGVWFLNNKITIPPDRLDAAHWVLQCSVITFVMGLISMPYNALIVAHEHMKTFAYMGILENVLKLIILFFLYNLEFDSLKLYATLWLCVSIILRIIYGIYSKRHFKESEYQFVFDKGLFKQMFSFAGWNAIGTSALIFKEQGVNIAINVFQGPSVNAARAIAMQVNSAVSSFAGNFTMALNPQITKSYASGDRSYMMDLNYKGAKLAFFLLLFLSLPIIIEANYILGVWLKVVPEHAVNLVKLILLNAMAESISYPLITAQSATGRIKIYQIVVGGLLMLNFPISYIALKFGFDVEVTLIIALAISQLCLFARLYMLRNMISLNAIQFIKEVYLRIIATTFISAILPLMIYNLIDEGFIRFILVGFTCCLSTIFFILYLGCTTTERKFVLTKISEQKDRVFRK